MRAALVLLVAAGCLEPRAQICGDKVCAPEARCDEATSTCIPAGCGDGVVNNKEQCDGDALGDVIDCASLGYYDHNAVTCTLDCSLDTSACTESCGDRKVDGPELCDGDAPSGQTCLDYGYGTGRIGCADACTPSFETCTTIGLTLEHAVTHSLHAIDGRARDDAYTVGGMGSILHFDGHTWMPVAMASIGTFTALWIDKSPSGRTVVAVGSDGAGHAAIARFDGQSWTQTVLSGSEPLNAVWGHGAEVWAVGGDTAGYAIHFDGTSWGAPVTQAGLAPLNGIDGDPATGRAVAVGRNKTTGVFDGTAWTWSAAACGGCQGSYSFQAVLSLGSDAYLAVGTSPPGLPAIAASSTDGGATWSPLAQNVEQTTLLAISGVPGDVYIAGSLGTLLRYDGKAFHSLTTGTISQFAGVWRAAADDVHVTIVSGEIRGLDAAAWADAGPIVVPGAATPADQVRLQGVATSPSGETMIVGNPSTVWSSTDGRTWTDASDGAVTANKNLTGAWFAPTGEAYVSVANAGNLLYRPGNGAFTLLQPFVTGTVSTSVFGFAADDLYVTAHGAKVFHGTSPTTWTSAIASSAMPDLAHAWGPAPGNVYVVGDDGLLAHTSDGATFTPVPLPGFTANLTGVWGTGPDDIFVVGKGAIVHYDGTAWRFQHVGSEDLEGVFGIAVPDPMHPGMYRRATDVFAFGPDSMFHYDGVSWSPMSLPLLFGALGASTLATAGRNDVIFVGTRGNAATLSRALAASETRCSDGWDDDRNGLVDCADPACAQADICRVGGGSCRIAGSLACGETVAASTFTGTARLDTLPMIADLTGGPEAVYRFDAAASGTVTLTLDTARPLDIVVTATHPGTAACDLQMPLAGHSGAGTLSFAAIQGASYAIIVDEAAGSAGDFTLTAACE